MSDIPIKPLYPNYPLSLQEGEEKLTDVLRQFHGSIVQAREPTKHPNPPIPHNIAIKAAGLGKTTQAIAELFVGHIKSKQAIHIEYYVPTHNLSAQLVNDIKSAYKSASERIKNKVTDKPDINVSINKGRQQTNSSGLPLCNKSEQVEQLTKLGYPLLTHIP